MALVVVGCRVTVSVPKTALKNLDGYRTGFLMVIPTSNGRAFGFTKESELLLVTRSRGTIAHHYREIIVRAELFRGVTIHAETVEVDFDDIVGVQIAAYSKGRAVGLVFGTLAVVVVVYLLVLIAIFLYKWAATGEP